MRQLTKTNGIAAAWGFLEATLFFIVPDVFLTRVAIDGWRRALVGCLYALLGALAGGIVMWSWGAYDADTACAIVELVPAIDGAMISGVRAQMNDEGALALFLGPLTGTPYKIYAVQAGAMSWSLLAFLLVSIPARLVRFVLLVIVTAAVSTWLCRYVSHLTAKRVLLACWIVFYIGFFAMMPG